MSSRRRRQFRRPKKNPPSGKNEDCCKNCRRETRPWSYAHERIRYKWKTLQIRPNQAKPCICFEGTGAMDDHKKLEQKIMQECVVQTKITNCNGKMKIQFVSNGDVVRKKLKEQQDRIETERRKQAQIRQEQQNRIEAERRKQAQIRKVNDFKAKLIDLRSENKFPFNELIDLSVQENTRLEKPGIGTAPGGIHQIYILNLHNVGYYVGQTGKGYPWRIYDHIRGHKSSITPHLKFGQDEWGKNLVSELMEIIQPINKKFRCSHVIEWWVQRKMKDDYGFSLYKGTGKNTFMDSTCDICNGIAKKHNLDWNS